MDQRTERSSEEIDLRSSDVEASERICRSCYVRDPVATQIFEGQEKVDMRVVCPQDVKKVLLKRAKTYLLENMCGQTPL